MIHQQNIKLLNVTPPAARVNNGSFTINEIDTKGFDYLTVTLYLGDTDIALTVMKLQESDTSGSGYADVSGGAFSSLPAATDDNKFYRFFVPLQGRKRYLKPVITVGNGSTGAFAAIWAELSRAEQAPDSVSERGLGGQLFV